MQPEFHFKLRLVKKPRASEGLYQQLNSGHRYDYKDFSLDDMKKALTEMYGLKPQTRSVKITTNQAGLDLFQKALKQQSKTFKNDRKRLSIKSKVFK